MFVPAPAMIAAQWVPCPASSRGERSWPPHVAEELEPRGEVGGAELDGVRPERAHVVAELRVVVDDARVEDRAEDARVAELVGDRLGGVDEVARGPGELEVEIRIERGLRGGFERRRRDVVRRGPFDDVRLAERVDDVLDAAHVVGVDLERAGEPEDVLDVVEVAVARPDAAERGGGVVHARDRHPVGEVAEDAVDRRDPKARLGLERALPDVERGRNRLGCLAEAQLDEHAARRAVEVARASPGSEQAA